MISLHPEVTDLPNSLHQISEQKTQCNNSEILLQIELSENFKSYKKNDHFQEKKSLLLSTRGSFLYHVSDSVVNKCIVVHIYK